MVCPSCSGKMMIIDSRHGMGNVITRRRECRDCGKRYNSTEILDVDMEKRKNMYIRAQVSKELDDAFAEIIAQVKKKMFGGDLAK